MKTDNPFRPAQFDLVVTRHRPLVEWLLREVYIDESTPVVEHAHADRNQAEVSDSTTTPPLYVVEVGRRAIDSNGSRHTAEIIAARHNAANVRGKHVIGVLPHHLSCHAASITEVQLDWTREDRAAVSDLDVEAVARAARGLHTYVVRRACAEHSHSSAVEAAWRYVELHGTSFGAGPCLLGWAKCDPVRGLRVDMIGSGCEQAHAHIIMSRGLWRAQSKGPWMDGLGREVALDHIVPAAGWSEPA